jgi:hypothetical protein
MEALTLVLVCFDHIAPLHHKRESQHHVVAAVAARPAGNHRHGYPPPSERHRFFIRTGLAVRVTHFVSIGGIAMATGGIGVETVIQGGDDQHAVTIDVDIVRSCPGPGEVHRVASSHFVAARSEGDLLGCGCRRYCRCWRSSRAGGCRRRRCSRCGWSYSCSSCGCGCWYRRSSWRRC